MKANWFLLKSVFLTAGICLCGACDDDDDCKVAYFPRHYESISMGTVDNGNILTDKGNTLAIDSSAVERALAEGERVFLSCDILEREDEHRYRVKVNKYFQLLDKDCISLSAIDADTLGRNPINVSKAWFGGGYLNMRMELETDPSSNVSHWVNLAYDDERSTADTIRLRLYHNAFGDTIRTRLGAADASFDIRDFVTSEKVYVVLEWPWYDRHGQITAYTDGGYYTASNQEETENSTDMADEGGVNIH